MEKLNYQNLEDINGGDIIEGLCYGVGSVGAGYAIGGNLSALTAGAVSNLWNPIGWIVGIAALVTVACVANGLAD